MNILASTKFIFERINKKIGDGIFGLEAYGKITSTKMYVCYSKPSVISVVSLIFNSFTYQEGVWLMEEGETGEVKRELLEPFTAPCALNCSHDDVLHSVQQYNVSQHGFYFH